MTKWPFYVIKDSRLFWFQAYGPSLTPTPLIALQLMMLTRGWRYPEMLLAALIRGVSRKRTNNDLQNNAHKAKDQVTRTPLKTGDGLRCSDRVGSSCSTSGTCQISQFSFKSSFFFWSLCRLSLFDLRIQISPLVSSNYSCIFGTRWPNDHSMSLRTLDCFGWP
jgi:hypothetical protein